MVKPNGWPSEGFGWWGVYRQRTNDPRHKNKSYRGIGIWTDKDWWEWLDRVLPPLEVKVPYKRKYPLFEDCRLEFAAIARCVHGI